MNTNVCMCCGKELIADASAPYRFCSRTCFDTLVEKAKAEWDRRYREARANGNGAGNGAERERKPLSEILKLKREPLPNSEQSFKRRAW